MPAHKVICLYVLSQLAVRASHTSVPAMHLDMHHGW